MIKRLFDLLASDLAWFLPSPLLGLLALLVHRKLGSPVLFRQQRPGLNGRPFTLIKFRPAMRAMTDKRDAQGNLLPDAEWLTKSEIRYNLKQVFNRLRREVTMAGNGQTVLEIAAETLGANSANIDNFLSIL